MKFLVAIYCMMYFFPYQLDRYPLHIAGEQGHTNVIEILSESFKSDVLERTKVIQCLTHSLRCFTVLLYCFLIYYDYKQRVLIYLEN